MPKGEIEILGLKEIERTLESAMPKHARRIGRRAITRLGREVRDDARQRAPVGATRNLVRSIKSRRKGGRRDREEAAVYVDRSGGRSGKGYHWHLLEFGTRKMSAQPFIQPTIVAWRPKAPDEYARLWWPEFEKEMEREGQRQAARAGIR